MSRRLLLLCHANIARSPSAELIASRFIDGAAGWSVTSAGTHARVGHALDPVLGDALRSRGISTVSHAARQADGALLHEADLILSFDRGQRDWVAQHFPASVRHTTTIGRAARLVRSAPKVDFFELLMSDTAPYAPDDDFEDPFGGGPAVAAQAVEDIESLLRVVLPAIGALPPGAEPPKATIRPTRRSLRRLRGTSP